MNWRNSDFQTEHFIVGKCHTPDEAYRVLCSQREDREMALATAQAERLREKGKLERALESLRAGHNYEAEADVLQINAFAKVNNACYEQAVRELAHINKLIEMVQPLRKYKHLPDHEAHQACQREEWKLELIHRAETFMLTQGYIPQGELSTMMAHPDYSKNILPKIRQLQLTGSTDKQLEVSNGV